MVFSMLQNFEALSSSSLLNTARSSSSSSSGGGGSGGSGGSRRKKVKRTKSSSSTASPLASPHLSPAAPSLTASDPVALRERRKSSGASPSPISPRSSSPLHVLDDVENDKPPTPKLKPVTPRKTDA